MTGAERVRWSPPISGLCAGSTERTVPSEGRVARRWARKTISMPISGGSSTGSPMLMLRQADWLQVCQSRLKSALTRWGIPVPRLELTEVSHPGRR